MVQQIKILSPITRLSGVISVKLAFQGNTVTNANVITTLFRGFEKMLVGREATDAPYFTQRVCGICSIAHGVAATYLIEKASGLKPTPNAILVRNILLGSEFLQNHLRHFYLFELPDYIAGPNKPPFEPRAKRDLRFNLHETELLLAHYCEATEISAHCHELSAIFGGKAPHEHSFLPGGITVAPTADKILKAKSLLQQIYAFVNQKMCPDTELLATRYKDYFNYGLTPSNYLCYGLFPYHDRPGTYIPAGVVLNGKGAPLDTNLISEDTTSTYFDGNINYLSNQKYSWTKSPRYNNQVAEGGPIARKVLLSNNFEPSSTMSRIVARTLETKQICLWMGKWLDWLKEEELPHLKPALINAASALAITDAPRGALLHQASYSGNKILSYNIITPSAWNLSPKDSQGLGGPLEQALQGTVTQNPNEPFEAGRIIRSFDPCISCSTH